MSEKDERLALLFSDGSMSIFVQGQTINEAREEAKWCDKNEKDQNHFTRVVRVIFPEFDVV